MQPEVRRRVAIIHHAQEVTGNVAMTYRYYRSTASSRPVPNPCRVDIGGVAKRLSV